MHHQQLSTRERLVHHIHALERLEALKQDAAEDLKDCFEAAKAAGFDGTTLKAVLKLRKMTPDQRRERRALEAIYLAELGMLDGDALPEEARRRLDSPPDDAKYEPPTDPARGADESATEPDPTTPAPVQAPLIVKDPEEARQEGAAAADAGKRIYDNPYPAGDPCRAAWDEGWCAKRQSNGMELPQVYQRRTGKPPEKGDKDPEADGGTKKGGE